MSSVLNTDRRKLQHVQVLRGVAALFVLFFHCMLNSVEYFNIQPVLTTVWQHGWMGVEFFFILSGFIITYIHFNDLENKSGVRRFLRKRIIRIYPIFWFVASVMLAYYLFVKKSDQGTIVTIKGANDFLYLVKCYLLFPTGARKNFIDIAWTLNYEVFFYVVFAIWIRLGLRTAYYLYFFWAILILLKHYLHIGGFSTVLDFMFNPMILYFLAGCLVAHIFRRQKRPHVKISVMVILLTAVLLFIYALITNSIPDQRRQDINYNYFLIVLFGGLLWFAASLDKRTLNWPLPRALVIAGDASYSLYLIHPAAIMFCYKTAAYLTARYAIPVTFVTGNLIFLATVFVSTVSGILLHLLVEKPMLKYLNSWYRSSGNQKLRMITQDRLEEAAGNG